MIWKIAKKESLLNLMTFKFAVGTLVASRGGFSGCIRARSCKGLSTAAERS